MNTNPNSYAAQEMNTPGHENLGIDVKPINWHLALDALEKLLTKKPDKVFQAMDLITTLTNASGNWITCAVGNQCKIIPRNNDGEPLDGVLSHRGIIFHAHLRMAEDHIKLGELGPALDRLGYAKRLLSLIEEHSAELINQINTQQNQ